MIYTYEECKKKYKTDYAINKAIKNNQLKRIRRGMYTDEINSSDPSLICRAYPQAALTMHSAFYYHGLTDTIPDKYCLITNRGAKKIENEQVKQFFDNSENPLLGVEIKEYSGSKIRILNRERMLIELIRNKHKLSFDYYKEIISNYRRIVYTLDIQAIQEYAEQLPKTKMVMKTLELEVF